MSGVVDPHFDLFIAGESVPASRGEPRVLLNPADNRPLTSVAAGTADDAKRAMEAAEKAFRESGWAGDDGARRGRTLWKLARLLEDQSDAFALLETLNMGKTLKESRFDVGYVVRTLEYFAGLADKVHGETIPVPGPGLTTPSASPWASRCTSRRGTIRSFWRCDPWPRRSRPGTPWSSSRPA